MANGGEEGVYQWQPQVEQQWQDLQFMTVASFFMKFPSGRKAPETIEELFPESV